MKSFVLALLFLTLFILNGISKGTNINYSIWNDLLSRYVNQEGLVDYEGFQKDNSKLDEFLTHLSENIPNNSWDENEKLAYWINAYNAFTISLILKHYPLKSIMDIDKAWDINFIVLNSATYSLNKIEHEIIRKEFDEPRIHFVLVCAAVSCPKLLNEAIDPAKLEEQLQKQGKDFINDPVKNKLTKKNIQLSQLFNWFKDDFTKKRDLINYLNEFAEIEINPNASIEFLEYDWRLNKQ